ncbi:MAG: hypothetical protein Q9180_006223 [Flavoplaca navasiana]
MYVLELYQSIDFFQEFNEIFPQELVALAESAAHTFWKSYNEHGGLSCDIRAGVVKAAITSAFVLLKTTLSATQPAVPGVIPRFGTDFAGPSSLLGGKGSDLDTIAWNIAHSSRKPGVRNANPNGVCHSVNTNKGLERMTKVAIESDILDFYQNFLSLVQSVNEDVIGGLAIMDNPLLPESTLLANKIRSGEYFYLTPTQYSRFNLATYNIEYDFKQHFKTALVSQMLKDQKCYIHCSPRQPSKADVTTSEPEKGKFCIVKCLQNGADGQVYDFEDVVYDLNQIPSDLYRADDWTNDTQAFIKASYDHYKANGIEPGRMLPSGDQLFAKGAMPSMGYLPVCDSHLGPPKKNGHSDLPCMCGDQYGSETSKFWTAAGFATEINGNLEIGEGPPYMCKNDMSIAQTKPVAYFMNMCNMGWRWPTQMDNQNKDRLQKGPDPHCAAFEAEAQVSRANGVDVDCYMCHLSDQGEAIQSGKESQRPRISNMYWSRLGNPRFQNYNFKRACEVLRENDGPCFGK